MHVSTHASPARRLSTCALVTTLSFVAALVGPRGHAEAQAEGRAPVTAAPATPAAAPTPLDVNTATAAQLDALPGIGPSKVEAILRLRTERPFRRLSDLLRVPGIGRATLERLRPYLAFPAPPARR